MKELRKDENEEEKLKQKLKKLGKDENEGEKMKAKIEDENEGGG